MKHEPPSEVWEHHYPQKIFEYASSEIESGVFCGKNCYAKDRLWKSSVREISLAVHVNQSMPILGVCPQKISFEKLISLRFNLKVLLMIY